MRLQTTQFDAEGADGCCCGADESLSAARTPPGNGYSPISGILERTSDFADEELEKNLLPRKPCSRIRATEFAQGTDDATDQSGNPNDLALSS
jgi:hypothetical protein